MKLKDAVAVITGGGSGLGEATGREFAAAGARIVVLDLANSPGPRVAESFRREGSVRRRRRGIGRGRRGRDGRGGEAFRHDSYRGELRGRGARATHGF